MSMAPQLHTTFAYCLWFLTRLLICSTAVVGGASAQHAVVQTLDRSLAAFEIQGGIQALTEIGPGIGIAAIASGARGAFKTVPADTVFSLTENHTLWIHLRFASTAAQRTDWTVSIPLPHLDHVMVYLRNETGHWATQVAGNTTPTSQWSSPALYPEFRLQMQPGTTHDVYLQIRNEKPLAIPLRLAVAQVRDTQRALEYTAIGIVLGALLMLLGSCAIQYLVTEDAAVGWYSAYIVLMMLVISVVTGVAGQWLWPNSPVWSHYSFMVLPLLGVGATVLFAMHVCALEVTFPRFARGMLWLGWMSLPLTLLGLFIEQANAAAIQTVYLAVSPLVTITGTVMSWRRGSQVGKWLFFSFLPQGLAVALLAAQLFNWTPSFWEARYWAVLAVAISIPLVLQALHLRARMRHEAEDRASSLSRQDALTGLLIKPMFVTHVERALDRALNDKESSAIVMIEVVNHASLRDAYGEAVAEQCLLRAVVKLHRILRDVDPAGRVDTSRFGLILEGVNSRQTVSERMVGLIASGLIPLPGLKPEVTLQFHIACVLLNEIVPDHRTVLDQLAEVLDNISPRSRRPIRFLEPANTVPASFDGDSAFNADDTGSFMAPPARI